MIGEKIMNPKILVLAYPGIGKTYMADNYENVIDFEQQHFISIYDEDIRHLPLEQIKGQTSKRKPNPDWPQNYVEGIRQELETGRIVITTFIPATYKALCEDAQYENVRIILAVFDPNSFEELAQRYRERNNTEEFIERRRADFPTSIKLFEEAPKVEKVVVKAGEYLADALINHGIELNGGRGFKNYI